MTTQSTVQGYCSSTVQGYCSRTIIIAIFISFFLLLLSEQVQAGHTNNETFAAPLAGWKNLKTDYGAVGNGAANDTGALQNALNDLRAAGRSFDVLYIPSGTYLITNTLNFSLTSNVHGAIFGESADNTTILWNSTNNATMIDFNPQYFSMGRLTLDGNRKAGLILNQRPSFSTANEFFDMVFKNAENCMQTGDVNEAGIAEVTIYRSRFSYCANASIRVGNFNSLNWWIWDSRFENNSYGVTNVPGAGHFRIYQSVFINSTGADIFIGNTDSFGIRDTFSNGSYRFFDSTSTTAGAVITLQRNTILESIANDTIRIGNAGPMLLIDNIIRSGVNFTSGAVVRDNSFSGATIVAVNNTFTAENHYATISGTVLRNISENWINYSAFARALPAPVAQPVRHLPTIFEVQSNATYAEIQSKIEQASALFGQRAVVHLANGTYNINQTIVIPNGSDVQLVGEAIYSATQLKWTGAVGGTVLSIRGPSHALIKHIHINGGANNATGIVINYTDEAGARIYIDQVQAVNCTGSCLYVNRSSQNTSINVLNFQQTQAAVAGIKVLGRGSVQDPAKVKVLGEGLGSNHISYEVDKGGQLLVRDARYEASVAGNGIIDSISFANFTGSGKFMMDVGQIIHVRNETSIGVSVNGFNGSVSFASTIFDLLSPTTETRIIPGFRVSGSSPEANASLIASSGRGNTSAGGGSRFFNISSSNAKAGLMASQVLEPSASGTAVSDEGTNDTSFLVAMLELTRSVGPIENNLAPNSQTVTDLELYRVRIETVIDGIVIESNYVQEDEARTSSSVGGSNVVPGGGEGSSDNAVPLFCQESWICAGWSECKNGTQNRECIDEHGCHTISLQPLLEKTCSNAYTASSKNNAGAESSSAKIGAADVQENTAGQKLSKNNLIMISLFIFALTALIIMIILHQKKHH